MPITLTATDSVRERQFVCFYDKINVVFHLSVVSILCGFIARCKISSEELRGHNIATRELSLGVIALIAIIVIIVIVTIIFIPLLFT